MVNLFPRYSSIVTKSSILLFIPLNFKDYQQPVKRKISYQRKRTIHKKTTYLHITKNKDIPCS